MTQLPLTLEADPGPPARPELKPGDRDPTEAAWDLCPNACRLQGFRVPCAECIAEATEAP